MASDVEPGHSQVSIKTALTISLTVLGVVAITFAVVQTRAIILLTVASALVATALHHGVDLLVRHRMKRPLALGLIVLAVFAVAAGIVLLLVPPVVQQGQALVEDAPALVRRAQQSPAFHVIQQRLGLSTTSGGLGTTFEEGAGSALRAVTGLVGGLATLASAIALVIFMLIFGRRLVTAWLAETLPERRVLYERVGSKIYDSVGRYLVGLAFIGSVNATLTTTFLAIVHIPFFLPLGILAGISSFIPYAGPLASGATITLIALATKGPWAGLATLIYFILYGQLEGQVLGPLVYRKAVDVDPLVTLLAILFMAELVGIVGAVIAVPAAAAAQIILRELLAIRRERLGL